MTARTLVFQPPGQHPAAPAERLTASPEPASLSRPKAFATGRPTLAVAAACSVARVLPSRRTHQQHEAHCPVGDEAGRVDWPTSGMAALGTWPNDETATDETARLAGPKS